VGREGRLLSRLVRRNAHRPEKRVEPHLYPGSDGGRRSVAQVVRLQERLRKVVGEEAETGNHGRPAPGAGRELQDLDLERVADLGSLDEDGPGEVVDRVEVPRDLADRRGLGDLARPGDRQVEADDVARTNPDGRGTAPVPVVVDVRRAEPVLAAHGAPPRRL
jgi:hypothetical protein